MLGTVVCEQFFFLVVLLIGAVFFGFHYLWHLIHIFENTLGTPLVSLFIE